MKNRNTLSIPVLAAFGFLMFSCGTWIDCDQTPKKLKMKGLVCENLKIEYPDTADYNIYFSLIDDDSVLYSEYGIHLMPFTETYVAHIQTKIRHGLLNTAYACSPVIPSTDERIDSIIITSSKTFDLNHEEYTDLSSLFDVIVQDENNGFYNEKLDLTSYVNTRPYVPIDLLLVLKNPPGETADFSFQIDFYFEGIDNDYFELETDTVTIVKQNTD